MLKLLHPLPNSEQYHIAVSGGKDSVSALKFLLNGKRVPKSIIYYNHNTVNYSNEAEEFVRQLSLDYSINFNTSKLTKVPTSGESKEAFWRTNRYIFFNKISKKDNLPIITAHNLNDCLEQYIMSTLIRIKQYKLIPYNGPSNTIRPFRTWKRKDIESFFQKNNLTCINDPSNSDCNYTRNYVRHNVLPHLLRLNPGLYNHVLSLLEKEQYEEIQSR